ncbi:MAG: hypothetical protein ACYC8T_30380 [Myxococcaceae bacterium]
MSARILRSRLVWFGVAVFLLEWGAGLCADLRSAKLRQDLLRAAVSQPVGEVFSPVILDPDSYHWIRGTQEMVQARSWRVRHTDWDNAPYGREVHWAALNYWWLALEGAVAHLLSGEPLLRAIERAAPWSNTLLLLLATGGGTLVIGRRLGARAAAAFLVMFGGSIAIRKDFGFGNADHHGFHDLAVLGMVVALGAGLGGRAGSPRAWVAVSGAFGAIGLWIGATQQSIPIAAAGLGAGLAALVARADASTDARLWRVWGLAGAAGSLLLYLLEYFPFHLGMRLEVNHPAYAVAWAAGGEALYRWSLAVERRSGRNLAVFVPALLLSALPALLIGLGPTGWHALRGAEVARFHRLLAEFLPLASAPDSGSAVLDLAAPLLTILACVIVLAHPSCAPTRRLALSAGTAAAIALWIAALLQVRWSGLATAATAGLGVTWWATLPKPPSRRRETWLALGVGLAWLATGAGASALRWLGDPRPRAAYEATALLAARSLATGIRAQVPPERARVIFAPMATWAPALFYYGGVRMVGSQYWTNAAGLEADHRMLGTYDAGEAQAIARERGITHIVIAATRLTVENVLSVSHGAVDWNRSGETLVGQLCSMTPHPPAWLEEAPSFQGPYTSPFKLRVFVVRPPGPP